MIKWQSIVQLRDLHTAHQAGTISVQKVARSLAARLRRNKFSGEYELEEIIEDLESLAKDPKADVYDYDCILKNLYAFADDGNRIWIRTL